MKGTDSRGSLVAGESIGTAYDTEEIVDAIGLDRAEIEWRKGFVGFTPEDESRVAGLEGVVEAREDELIDAFLEPIYTTNETREITDRSPRDDDALRAIVGGYLRSLTDGEYDQSYYEHRTRIGRLHNRLEMPLHYFTGMFGNLTNIVAAELMDGLADSIKAELPEEHHELIDREVSETAGTLQAGVRALNLDMQVVNDTYLFTYSAQMRDEIERSAQMREAVGAAVEDAGASIAELEESTGTITDTTGEVESDAGSVAAEVSNLSATIEEIAATADEVNQTSASAKDAAETGRDAAERTVDRMAELESARAEIADDIDELVGELEEIEAIVDVIDDIADETNILALNASIEAARAGEAGEGFAVVADEVKSLATESQERAAEVEGVIEEVTERIDSTVDSLESVNDGITDSREAVGETEAALEAVEAKVDAAASGMSEVSAATDDQAATTEEVNAMVDSLADRFGDVSAAADEIDAEIDRQREQIDDIDAAVEQLRSHDEIDFDSPTDSGEWDGPVHPTDVPARYGRAPMARSDGGVSAVSNESRVSGAASANEASAPASTPEATRHSNEETTDDRTREELVEALPEGMPDFAIDRLDDETLAAIVDGDADRPRWTKLFG